MLWMGEYNSSLTRVQPVFNALLDRWPDGDRWLSDLWSMTALTRPEAGLRTPENIGTLLPTETPSEHSDRLGKVFERTIAPPLAFLRWLLNNPESMQVRDSVSFGAKSESAQHWRRKLFASNLQDVNEAQREGLAQLEKRLAQRGRNKWWAFEGFSHIDCCLVTETCVLFVEGKRTESVSPSTLWFKQRSQLWRNVEAAQEFAGGRQFGVILAVEQHSEGVAALDVAAGSLVASYPHRNTAEQAELSRHLVGFVTWSEIVARFDLPPSCLIEKA